MSNMKKENCIYPDCQITGDFKGRACEHSCPWEKEAKTKPSSKACLAREVPGATCMWPMCDC